MAKTKAEIESDRDAYLEKMASAKAAERKGLFREAIKAALSAWPYIDGMMQFEKRYEKRAFDSVDAIDLVLKYSPLLLDFESLNVLENLLQEYKRIERDTSADMSEKLAQARERMWANHKLWTHLEWNPETKQSDLRKAIGGEQEYWRTIAETWSRMGLVKRVVFDGGYVLSLVTRTGAIAKAKCSSCGKVSEAPKAMFFDSLKCAACKTLSVFVILPEISDMASE